MITDIPVILLLVLAADGQQVNENTRDCSKSEDDRSERGGGGEKKHNQDKKRRKIREGKHVEQCFSLKHLL